MFRVLGCGKLGWEYYSFLVHLPGYIGRLALLCIYCIYTWDHITLWFFYCSFFIMIVV
jgi:hypothetical protein